MKECQSRSGLQIAASDNAAVVKLRRVSKDLCKLLAAYLLHYLGLAKGKPFPVGLQEPASKRCTLHLVKVTPMSRSSAMTCMLSEQTKRDMLLLILV